MRKSLFGDAGVGRTHNTCDLLSQVQKRNHEQEELRD
jgi:hypothetical protein